MADDWNDYDPPKPEPTVYEKDTSFESFEASNPSDPKPGSKLDAELDKIATALKETQNRARMLQREDGSMAESVVRRESLQGEVTEYLEELETNAESSADQASSRASDAENARDTADSRATDAEQARDAAEQYRDEARLWASEDEDTEVVDDLYSAYHWARKAEEWAEVASGEVIQDDETSDKSTWSSEKIDAEVQSAKESAKDYTDSEVQSAKDYTDSEIGEVYTHTDRATSGAFVKSDMYEVAWAKTGSEEAEVQKDLRVRVADKSLLIPEGTSIQMPDTLDEGTDYALWITPDGDVVADASFSAPPEDDAVWRGGFHYAPGGNADLDSSGDWSNHTGGDDTPQINKYSFWDWKFRPAAPDPRGLTLVNGAFWAGMYLMRSDTTAGVIHVYGVEPARDGNSPQKPYGDGSTYGNAKPMNIFECLAYHGFRAPSISEFQLLALGTTEEDSAGGGEPGLTGGVTDRDRYKFTSAWGVFDATGVLRVWGRDSFLEDHDTDVTGVTEGRSDETFRVDRFVSLGGYWGYGSGSGSRYVSTNTADNSNTNIGGRGVCDHLILV